ncbi:putative membrane protein [Ilumatobacter fluminis]|uniref:Putative membrane protein n=1 Tax=Ilumatobacter fluminis TaxID=467091 RepID=A0A4R7I2X5_9ACTN|nr:DUF1269 domain-containing protein [Ilumatobacter fluminis]TDT17977.1 putative membrane protein [Ilumatobacter fluminis]
MATLTVWKFDHPDTAATLRVRVLDLERDGGIDVHDAVVVSWPDGASKPRTDQMDTGSGWATAGGAFWGLLIGAIFFLPLFGLAFGAGMGALSGSLRDFGIDDGFIETVRDRVTPGTSALFLLTSDADLDRVHGLLAGVAAELVATNLSEAEDHLLADLFRDDA